MRRTTIALTVLVVFAATLVPAFAAAPAKNAPAKPTAAHKKMSSAVCPVMGTKITDVTKAPGGKSVYKGKTYYFCCAGCKTAFDKNPARYIKKMAEKKPAPKAAPKKP